MGNLALLTAAGCGSRTSMLDADVYGVDAHNVEDGGSAGSAAQGGNAGRGGTPGNVAGTGVSPSAGTPSVGGKPSSDAVDPSLASMPCAQYCPGYGTQCRERLNGQDCFPTCQNELNSFGKTCQTLGVKALTCLTPFFSPNGGDCDDAVGRALAQCNKVVKQFEACKKKFSGGSTPSPNPTTPTTPFDPTTCPRGPATGGTDFCVDSYQCGSGEYIVTCKTDPSTRLAACFCQTPSGTHQASVPGRGNACQLAAQTCF